MSFAPELLDELARCFAEAAVRELMNKKNAAQVTQPNAENFGTTDDDYTQRGSRKAAIQDTG